MLNLKFFFDKVCTDFKLELERSVKSQTGLDGQKYSPIRPSTAKARQAQLGLNAVRTSRFGGKFFNRGIVPTTGKGRKATGTGVPITRLLFTGKFWQGAFKFATSPSEGKVFVSRGNYPVHWTQAPVSYNDIVSFNNKGSARLNSDIKNPPLVFPTNYQQVWQTQSGRRAVALWKSPSTRQEMLRQMRGSVIPKATHHLRLG